MRQNYCLPKLLNISSFWGLCCSLPLSSLSCEGKYTAGVSVLGYQYLTFDLVSQAYNVARGFLHV